MKTTLRKTLRLAGDGVITNSNDIRKITTRVKNIPITEFEKETHFFNFVRNFEYVEGDDERDEYFGNLKFDKAISLVDMFRADNEEQDFCYYIKQIMSGILAIEGNQDVRLFKSISLLKYLSLYRADHKYFIERAEQYLGCDVNIGMSIGEFFEILKDKFNSPWDICQGIDLLEMEVMICGELLDIIFCDCMLNGDNE